MRLSSPHSPIMRRSAKLCRHGVSAFALRSVGSSSFATALVTSAGRRRGRFVESAMHATLTRAVQ